MKLFNKNFILLWQGQLVSAIGTQIAIIVLALWIKHNLNSASMLGLSMMVYSITNTLASPFAGTFADILSRKRILIVSDLISGIVTILLSVMILIQGTNPFLMICTIIVYNFLLGLTSSFLTPTVTSILPDLVPASRLSKANSMVGTAIQLSTFGGQAISGILFKMLGAPLLIFFDGMTYLFSALSEMFIHDAAEETTKAGKRGGKDLQKAETLTLKKFSSDLRFGFIYIYKEKGIRNIVLGFAFMNVFLAPFIVLLPFFVEDYLNLSSFWYGAILAGFSGGMFLGIISASFITIRSDIHGKVIGFLMILFAALTGSLAFIRRIDIVMTGFVLAGAIQGYFSIVLYTILQRATPKNFRGRVFGIIGTISGGLMPLGMGLTGIITDLLNKNVPLIFSSSSMMLFIVSVFVFFNKDTVRFFDDKATVTIAVSSSIKE